MFRNDDIPQEYNNLAEISDNYLVWVRESTLQSGTSYSAYVQFLSPSFSCFFIDNYRIRNGTNYTLVPNYNNNGLYSYIDDYDLNYSLTTYNVDLNEFNSNLESRADYLTIIFGFSCIVVLFMWVINHITRLCVKGGV